MSAVSARFAGLATPARGAEDLRKATFDALIYIAKGRPADDQEDLLASART